MEWTSKTPTKPGFYWAKGLDVSQNLWIRPVEINNYMRVYELGDDEDDPVSDYVQTEWIEMEMPGQ